MGLYTSTSMIHLPKNRLCRICVPRSPYWKMFWLLLLLICLLFYGIKNGTQKSNDSADILESQPNAHLLFMDCDQYDCHMCGTNGAQTDCNYCPMPIVTGMPTECKNSCKQTVIPYSRPTPGQWRPKDCTARSKIAFVIPYRDRREHLDKFLKLMVPYFQRQLLDFTLIVAEQKGQLYFNKGRIMNAAFKYVTELSNKGLNNDNSAFDCIVFHDVDMIPESDGPYYGCAKSVKHLGAYVRRRDQYNYKLMYHELVGGVVSFPLQSYQKVNGFSNLYWGWGGEDDDMGFRLLVNRVEILRDPRKPVYFYSMNFHAKRRQVNRDKIARLLKTAKSRWKDDGLNQVNVTTDYHHLLIDVGHMPDAWLKRNSIHWNHFPLFFHALINPTIFLCVIVFVCVVLYFLLLYAVIPCCNCIIKKREVTRSVKKGKIIE